MDRDVYIIKRLVARKVLLKVFHRREKESFVAAEVLRALLRLVTHVDQHLVLHCCRRCHWDHRIRACIVANQLGGSLALVGPGLVAGATGQRLLYHV